jgi:hypothetical protein
VGVQDKDVLFCQHTLRLRLGQAWA